MCYRYENLVTLPEIYFKNYFQPFNVKSLACFFYYMSYIALLLTIFCGGKLVTILAFDADTRVALTIVHLL